MRSLALLAALTACTKPNPVYCDETRTCSGELVCDLTHHICTERADAGSTGNPTVIATSPANNAVGVSPDSAIVITFSEAMDQASVESAWASGDLPADQVVFEWNATGDTLTVLPTGGLPVATGTGLDPSTVTPMRIGFAIGTSATDTATTPLANSFGAAFTTVRRLTHDVDVIDSLTQVVSNDNVVISPTPTNASVGDTGFSNPCCVRTFVSFMLPTLPAGATVRDADFIAPQIAGTMGAPYTNLGSLRLQHINFASFSSAPYSATPLAVLGILSTDGAAMTKTFNVVAPVVDDYANEGTRGGRSQYRLEFAVATNGDALKDLTYFTRLGFKLRLKYDVP